MKATFRYTKQADEVKNQKELAAIANNLGVTINDLDYARHADLAWIGRVEIMGRVAIVTVSVRSDLAGQVSGSVAMNVLTPGLSIGATGMYLDESPRYNDTLTKVMEEYKAEYNANEIDFETLQLIANNQFSEIFNVWFEEKRRDLFENVVELEVE